MEATKITNQEGKYTLAVERINKDGKWLPETKFVSTTDGIHTHATRNYQADGTAASDHWMPCTEFKFGQFLKFAHDKNFKIEELEIEE